MDLHYKQEATVGLLVLAGIALFVAGTMWLSGKPLRPSRNVVQVVFTDIGNMKEGNPVRISGVQLGTVQAIRYQDVGRVMVTLDLDRRIQARRDATARIGAVGLVGEVVVNFDPGQASEPLPADGVIEGTQEEGLMALGTDLGDQARAVMSGLEEVANQRLADNLNATLESLRRLTDAYADRNQGPTAALTATMESLQQLSERLDSVLAGPGLDRTLENLDSVSARLGRLTDQYADAGKRLESILARVDRGEGTLGRIATDSTLYTELASLSTSLREFVDDLRKHPGKITVQVKIF